MKRQMDWKEYEELIEEKEILGNICAIALAIKSSMKMYTDEIEATYARLEAHRAAVNKRKCRSQAHDRKIKKC